MRKYDEVKEQMKTGDCLLFSSFSPIASGIKMFTNSEWAMQPWSFGSVNMREKKGIGSMLKATAPYVKLTRLSGKMEHYTGYIAWLPLPDYYDDLRSNMGHLMLECIDKEYDYKSVLKQALRPRVCRL